MWVVINFENVYFVFEYFVWVVVVIFVIGGLMLWWLYWSIKLCFVDCVIGIVFKLLGMFFVVFFVLELMNVDWWVKLGENVLIIFVDDFKSFWILGVGEIEICGE